MKHHQETPVGGGTGAGVDTHCPYCALQCATTLTPESPGPQSRAAGGGSAVQVAPREFPTNRGGLCAKGWTRADATPADGVTVFRTVEDCERIAAAATGGPMAVLGGGLLGIEAARGLAGLGIDVTVVHPFGHPMERQLDPDAGAVLTRALRRLGVRFRFTTTAASWRPGALTLSDASMLRCAGVVVTAGVAPRIRLAEAAGLRVGRGVIVDDLLAASAPGVYAIGECAEHRGHCHGLVGPCWEQADVLADLLTGAYPHARYRGSSPVTRLKARDIDLAAMGEPTSDDDAGSCSVHGPDAAACDPSDPGGDGTGGCSTPEVVRLSDPGRGRYGRLVLRGGRITGAVLLGLPEGTGPVIALHHSGDPAPEDRFSLLLGRAPAAQADSPARLPATAVVCRCNTVSKRDLVTAWQSGARDVEVLAGATRATTGCGGCTGAVTGLCDWLNEQEPAGPVAVPSHETTEQEGAA